MKTEVGRNEGAGNSPSSYFILLTVYDVLGRVVGVLTDGYQTPGTHEAQFDGTRLASGVYFCRLQAGSTVQTTTMMLLR